MCFIPPDKLAIVHLRPLVACGLPHVVVGGQGSNHIFFELRGLSSAGPVFFLRMRGEAFILRLRKFSPKALTGWLFLTPRLLFLSLPALEATQTLLLFAL